MSLDLKEYPALARLVAHFDRSLRSRWGDFFGPGATHPVLPVKRSKVIHDSLWGTNRYSWQELLMLDSPLLQRLREIAQVGLAHHVYPSARHTRFEHTLGVVTVASRIFDALHHRQRDTLRTIIRAVYPASQVKTDDQVARRVKQLRQELRLAALLHDCGHSLFSHASEKVYGTLPALKAAMEELSRIVGMTKGAGEVLSFCLALTPSVRKRICPAQPRLIGEGSEEEYKGPLDLTNVALLIVGRSRHPSLQFLGDIISSSLDADKLDYLMRDATSAGLPLRYDLDMYLYSIRLHKEDMADGEHELERLYGQVNPKGVALARLPVEGDRKYESYEGYRLRLPKKAMHVIEQIVICKLMLFSYLYHHSKARAAEGLLERILKQLIERWRAAGSDDGEIICRFLDLTDGEIHHLASTDGGGDLVPEYSRRLAQRLLPREVYRLSRANASHAEGAVLATFLNALQDRARRDEGIRELEDAIGRELVRLDGTMGDSRKALVTAGVMVDVASLPKFEDLQDLVVDAGTPGMDVPVKQLFPIGQWQQAWTHYRYHVRIYAFSEYWDWVEKAARKALQSVLGIENGSFYVTLKRERS